MKILLVCILSMFNAFVGLADTSITISNRYALVAGQAVMPASPNFSVLWPNFSRLHFHN